MNTPMIRYLLGRVLQFQTAFLGLCVLVGLIYRENECWSFALTALVCLLIGTLYSRKKPQDTSFYAKEGYMVVALSWILLSVTGAVPFVLNGEIPRFEDALFEVASGFTTTGASILTDVEVMSHTGLFWRSFTHWVGGMGVLVFMLAVMPAVGGQGMFLMQAESPGPSVGKLVPRLRETAKLLYGLYVGMTLLQLTILLCLRMPIFDAVTITLGTAGTGGFAIKADGLASYSAAIQTTVTVFMILFGVNFNVYFLLWVKKPKEAFKCEEARVYFGIIAAAILLITVNVCGAFDSVLEAFHHAAFQVGSIITTTGYSTVDFNQWPEFSKTILVMIMFVGACAGSTGGGIKVSRIMIMFKTIGKELDCIIHPRTVKKIRFEGRAVEHEVQRSINVFFIAYMLIFAVSLLVISLDNFDFTTNFTAVAATINNIGPGLNMVGPAGNFSEYSVLSKVVLTVNMLLGRLEIFPLLILMMPYNWKGFFRRRKV